MHTPPAVSYPVRRSAFAAGLALLGLALALAVWIAWVLTAADVGWRQGLVAGVLLLGAALAGRSWQQAPEGQLLWRGDGWAWLGPAGEGSGRIELGLDLQQRVLVRWWPEGGRPAWLWLERHRAPHDWDAMRRAVYSRARTEAPRGAQPPLAEP